MMEVVIGLLWTAVGGMVLDLLWREWAQARWARRFARATRVVEPQASVRQRPG